jgi:hypothetical protein
MTWSENSGSSKNVDFPPIQKNSKWIPKNIKNWFTSRFGYGDWIERFGSIISNSKLIIKRKSHNALLLCKAP